MLFVTCGRLTVYGCGVVLLLMVATTIVPIIHLAQHSCAAWCYVWHSKNMYIPMPELVATTTSYKLVLLVVYYLATSTRY
jgi:hypothetical protein